jgi:SnoaL-like protein
MAENVSIDPIARRYFDAVEKGSAEALAEAFAEDGKIVDVGRTISGRDAIRAWAVNEVIGGHYQLLEAASFTQGQTILLEFTPPSAHSGFRARYNLTFGENQIMVADLQYA